MRKLIRRFKDNGDEGKIRKRGGGKGSDVNINVKINVEDDHDAKYFVDPNHRPPEPSIKASNTNHGEPAPAPGPQDEVGTFAGFDSWLTSFTPAPQENTGAMELPDQPVEKLLLHMEGFPSADYIDVIVSGVRKPSHANKIQVCIQGPWYMTLKQVTQLFKDYQLEPPLYFKHAFIANPAWNGSKALPKEFQILAVDGKSCYDIDAPTGLLISKDEPIGSFNNTLRRLKIQCQDGRVLATSFPAQLEISFIRTLRLPENSAIVDQPAGVGHIPVSNIACVKKKLENSGNPSLVDMARKGGVFFPMYQREAMFMSFKTTIDAFAIRPFVGGVNAVSGLPWNVPASQRSTKQDYISAPPQKYVDGITVAQDTVKQFIAMPLGSGYSVEKQVTGKEDVGGIQLEIVPGNQWRVTPPGITFGLEDTLRGLGTDFVVLGWKDLSVGEKPVANMDDSVADWIQEHRPVYMRHLYNSQVSPPADGYGLVGGPWLPGGTVNMKAVYRFSLTVTYTDNGANRTKSVEWLPWWTVDECLAALSDEGVKIASQDPCNGSFTMMHEGRQLGPKTLQEEGVQDHAIISVVRRANAYQNPQPAAPVPADPYSGTYPPYQLPTQNHPISVPRPSPQEQPQPQKESQPQQPPQPQEQQPSAPGPVTFESYQIDYGDANRKSRFRISLNPFSRKSTHAAQSTYDFGVPQPPVAPMMQTPQMAPIPVAPSSPTDYTAQMPACQAPAPTYHQTLHVAQQPQQQTPGAASYAPVAHVPSYAPVASTPAYSAPEPQQRMSMSPSQAATAPAPVSQSYDPSSYASQSYGSPGYASSGYSSLGYSSPVSLSAAQDHSSANMLSAVEGLSSSSPGYSSPAAPSPGAYNSYSPPLAQSNRPHQSYSQPPTQAQPAQQSYSPPQTQTQQSYSSPPTQAQQSYSPPSTQAQPAYQAYSPPSTQAQPAYQSYSPSSAPSQASYGSYSPSAPSSATTYQPPRRSDSMGYPSPMTPSHTPAPKSQSKIDQVGWAMGIAAGSRIRQIVHKDPFSQSAWCKARGTMLSVQILNAVAFETLTGMLAPPTPITPELYKQKGLPFYETYGEAAATHDPYDSVGIKSVGEIDALEGNIHLGASFNGSTKVGCTCCGKMLCDSIIRPCNHTFCSSCIANYMTTYDNAVFCRICNTRATKLVGFSAPMALPGEDRVDFSDVKVITNKPAAGEISFFSIYELDAAQDGTFGGQKNDSFGVVYELG